MTARAVLLRMLEAWNHLLSSFGGGALRELKEDELISG
jgi:hypothetical protein